MLNAGFIVFASIVVGMRGDILNWLGVERKRNVSLTAPISTVQKDNDSPKRPVCRQMCTFSSGISHR